MVPILLVVAMKTLLSTRGGYGAGTSEEGKGYNVNIYIKIRKFLSPQRFYKSVPLYFILFFNLFIYLFIFGCVGSLLLRAGIL